MEKQLTIVQMNDTHAYLALHPELFWEHGKSVYRPAGGFARIAALLKKIRAQSAGQVLFVDGGDTFHGTYPAVDSRGEALLPVMSALGLHGMTAHWEFAYTPAGFQKLASRLNYPMLAMNVYRQDNQQLMFKPYEVVEIGGLRIGLAGIASNIVDKNMPPQFSQGVFFTDGREELPGVIERLRGQEKVDLVVLVSHLGFPQDMQLMKEIPGVDVDLSAHTHHRLLAAVKQGTALLTQSGSHGSFLTRLDLTVENGRVTGYDHQLIEVGEDIEPDSQVEDLVRAAQAPYDEMLNEVVGETRLPLDRGRVLESTMDNLLVQALRSHTGAQIAFSNGWRYGAPVMPGPVRINDLYNMAPMNPPLSTVDLSGAELKQMLEENMESTFSSDPFRQMGGYVKRADGIRVFFKIENPPMQRIHKIFVGEEEARPDTIYRAAFITEQGVPGKYGHNRQTHDDRTVDILRAHLKKTGPLEIDLQDAFVPI